MSKRRGVQMHAGSRLAPLREAVMERIVSIASLAPASPRKGRRMRISGTPGGPSGC
jgi:hypothetical protein